jgi:hypothetical protein
MSGLMQHTSPIAIAKETVAISKTVDSPAFQKMATWTLIASAAFTAMIGLAHAAHTLYRDMAGKSDSRNRNRRAVDPLPRAADTAGDEPAHETRPSGYERTWVNKARVADRTPERERQAHGGRH